MFLWHRFSFTFNLQQPIADQIWHGDSNVYPNLHAPHLKTESQTETRGVFTASRADVKADARKIDQ